LKLRQRVTLLRGQFEPFRRLAEPKRHAVAAGVERADGKMRVGDAGLGGDAKPVYLFASAYARNGRSTRKPPSVFGKPYLLEPKMEPIKKNRSDIIAPV
jgi:hypothetical protein